MFHFQKPTPALETVVHCQKEPLGNLTLQFNVALEGLILKNAKTLKPRLVIT